LDGEALNMQRSARVYDGHRKLKHSALGLSGLSFLLVFSLANATPSRTQLLPQAAPSPLPKYEYDVVSIKPYKPGSSEGNYAGGYDTLPNGFSARNLFLRSLILTAYGVSSDQLLGVPDWLRTEGYDVEVRMDEVVAGALQKLSPDDRVHARQQMLQALLADQLKLRVHRESKNLPSYVLVIAKDGPKFQEAKPDETTSISSTRNGETWSITVTAYSISSLALMVANTLSYPVVDKTGLSGRYDFKLEWSPAASRLRTPSVGTSEDSTAPLPDSSGTSILTALQDQLGLKLVSGKSPIEVIVIDHVQRPSGN
jgi:uncharacterized protein (TIGR03435 family)